LSANGLYTKLNISNQPIDTFIPVDDVYFFSYINKLDFINKAVFSGNNFYFKTLLIIRYSEIKNLEKLKNAAMLYLTLRIYGAIYLKYFPVGSAKKETMEYVVNNLTNKFDLKRLGTLQLALEKLALNNHENYKEKLVLDDDEAIYEYIEGLRTRINSFVKNVKNEFEYAYENKLYLNIEKTSAKNDEGEDFRIDRNTNSSTIYNAASNFVYWFSTNPINYDGLRIAKEFEPLISENNLAKVIFLMKNDKSNKMELLVSGIFGMLLEATNKTTLDMICNKQFVLFTLTVFSKTNSSDSNVVSIRDNITYFVDKTFEGKDIKDTMYLRYRKCLLIYLAYLIQKQRCNN
jgi:hypothetical protein